MTGKISLITVVATALVAVPAAWGKGQPPQYTGSPDVVDRAVAAQQLSTPINSPDAVDRAKAAHLSQQSNPIVSPDVVDRAVVANQSQPHATQPFDARSDGLNRMYGLGEYAPGTDATQPFDARSDGLNRMYGLGEYGGRVFIDDRREWLDPESLPVTVSATNSDRDIAWPQIGAGLGIGIVLAFGLMLALRHGRGRPLAHG